MKKAILIFLLCIPLATADYDDPVVAYTFDKIWNNYKIEFTNELYVRRFKIEWCNTLYDFQISKGVEPEQAALIIFEYLCSKGFCLEIHFSDTHTKSVFDVFEVVDELYFFDHNLTEEDIEALWNNSEGIFAPPINKEAEGIWGNAWDFQR